MISYDTQLILSIFIRVVAVSWSIYLFKKIEDWRMTLLTAMLSLMAAQQALRLLNISTEIPGFIVSLFALTVTVFVGKLILEHKKDELNLRQLNEKLEQHVAERTAALNTSNTELKSALAKVKALSGMLPICASCKKIRDDKGYWTQLEAYISDHSEAEFTHGYCPVCAQKALEECNELKARNSGPQ